MNKLRDCRRNLSRVKDKLAAYDSREDNLRDLRRQLSACEAKADQAEADAEARVDATSVKLKLPTGYTYRIFKMVYPVCISCGGCSPQDIRCTGYSTGPFSPQDIPTG